MGTLAGSNPEYKGPKTHNAIITQIYKEAKEKGYKFSRHQIERVVLRFFSYTGLAGFFRRGKNMYIKNFGNFIVLEKYKVRLRQKKIKRRKYIARWARKKRRRIKAEKRAEFFANKRS